MRGETCSLASTKKYRSPQVMLVAIFWSVKSRLQFPTTNMKSTHILFFIFVGLLIGILPFLIAWGVTPENAVFSGALVNPDDYSAYLSAIQQGRSGKWLYQNNFSPEPLQPQFMYILYIIIGRAAHMLGGSNIFWLHLSRLVFGLFAFWGLLFWVRSVFRENDAFQSTAWLLLSFGSGLGFLSLLFDPQKRPADIFFPEWNTISSLLSPPHFILACGLMATYYGALLRYEYGYFSWKWIFVAAICGIGIGLVYPFHIASIGLVTGLWYIKIFITQKKISLEKLGQGATILSPLSILLFYYAIIARQDALWRYNYVQNNQISPPSLQNLLIGSGMLGLFALFGIVYKVNNLMKSELLIPVLWTCISFVFIYSPIPFSGRFLLGFYIPIFTLAGFFIEDKLLRNVENRMFWHHMLIIITLPSTLLFILITTKSALINKGYPFYYSTNEVAAANWLATITDEEDLTLASYPIGSYLPGVSNTKVFFGQQFMTIDVEEKLALWKHFWNPETPQTWREDFVEKWEFSFIFQGAEEQMISEVDIELPWNIIYFENGVKIYSLESP